MDTRLWSLETLGFFTMKPLSNRLNFSSSMDELFYAALWKSKSPRKINILIWIMLNGSLNTSEILQKKISNSSTLLPTVCPLCLHDGECLNHVFFLCSYSRWCWFNLFQSFRFKWSLPIDLETMFYKFYVDLFPIRNLTYNGLMQLKDYYISYGTREINIFFRIRHALLWSVLIQPT